MLVFMRIARRYLALAFVCSGFSLHALAVSPDQEAYTQCVTTATSGKATVDEALAACSGPASRGATGAMYALGVLLSKSARATDRMASVSWLEKAANAGHALAAFRLAKANLDGASEAERATGTKWLRFAACSGYTPAEEMAKARGISAVMSDCPARALADFEGTWAGELAGLKADDPVRLVQISVRGNAVHVLTKATDKWIEVKAGKFTMSQLGPSLMITALDSGWDLDGQWIESWSFALLRLAPNEVFTTFTRSVNNPNLPTNLEWRFFTSVSEGRLLRQQK